VAGGTAGEVNALSLAQRWAGAIAGRIDLPTDRLPELRLVLAAEASKRFRASKADRDQLLARHLVTQVRRDWDDLPVPELREQLNALAGALLDIAWLRMSSPEGAGYTNDEAIAYAAAQYPSAVTLPMWPAMVEVVKASGEPRQRAAA
jgi:hypothetical protein